ncbi:MAG: HEPN domain-containing protein [Sulfolobus sp.]|nr:HEPN domain-containing protein [Sulfolobus sp.]
MAKWFEVSERNRSVAKLLLEKGFYPEACFHSHMAVELKLKGILLERTGSILYTHSLKRLLKEISKSNGIEFNQSILDCAEYLSLLYTGSRYPEEEFIELEREEAEKCVQCMERILNSI